MNNNELRELVHLLLMCGIMDKTATESGNVTNEEWLRMKNLINKYQTEGGINCEPDKSGDLISREALKKDFKERNKACDKWIENAKDEETKIRADATKSFICEVIMTIDNAPTVELTEDGIQKILNKYCMTAVANEYLIALHNKNETPKGKWLPRLHASENDIYVCSCCAKELGYDPNFCPNCGADMRGETDDG